MSSSRRAATHAILGVGALLTLFPLYWMILTSLQSETRIDRGGVLPLPIHLTLANYRFVWERAPFPRYLANSLIVAVAITALQLLTSTLAAYGFTRWRFPGREALFLLFLGTIAIPQQVTMIPNLLLVKQLHWFDTYAALIVPHLAAAYGIFFYRQHLRALPRDLFDAATLDGAGHWRTLWRVVVPVTSPSLIVLGILFFLNAWNEYFWPLLVTTNGHAQTVQIALHRFFGSEAGNAYGPMMAATTLATIPVLALFLVAQRKVVDAFISSGFKG